MKMKMFILLISIFNFSILLSQDNNNNINLLDSAIVEAVSNGNYEKAASLKNEKSLLIELRKVLEEENYLLAAELKVKIDDLKLKRNLEEKGIIKRGEIEKNKNPLNENSQLYFFGYDISHAKITDPKRSKQRLSSYLIELVDYLKDRLEESGLERWIGVKKAFIDYSPTLELNLKPTDEQFYNPSYTKNKLTTDSIQRIIEEYEIEVDNGIGYVVIYEYFSKERMSVTGYACLFDIETREIMLLLQQEYKDRQGYRSFEDYWATAGLLRKSFCTTLNPKKNDYERFMIKLK